MNPVAAALLVQALVSLLLALLLRALDRRVHERPLYRWWAAGWLLGAAWELALVGLMALGREDGPAFLLLATAANVASMVSLVCLAAGAQEAAPAPGDRPLRRLLLPVALLALVLLPVTAPLDALGPHAGGFLRSLLREVAAGATFLFCAFRSRRALVERAAHERRLGGFRLLTVCLAGWGITQFGDAAISLDCLVSALRDGSDLGARARALRDVLSILDFSWIFGLAAGTVLGVLDEYGRLEREMVQMRQYEAIGRLSGGIAHDFNNLLTAVLGSAGLLRGTLPAGHPGHEDVDEIAAAAARGAELTRLLLRFSASAPRPRECTDVAEALRAALPNLNALLGGVGLEVRTEPSKVLAAASRSDIDFLLVNIVRSASERLARDGKLSIDVHTVTAPAPIEGMLRTVGAGSYVVLQFEEATGTLLPAIGGTTEAGVGLAITCGIVEQWGGQAQVETHRDAAARTIVYLPAFSPGTAIPAGRA